MAEPKRHMDVPKERVLESPAHKHLCTNKKSAPDPDGHKARYTSRTVLKFGPEIRRKM